MEDELNEFSFDKFMKDINRREEQSVSETAKSDQMTPQREYIKRYRELPQNRTKWE